ncbi:SAM-dependent methyltransferase [Roseospira visakhapatnamensis]|uniref:SAM-dependent methyltransferase n=1 Tax=Roseospira visakhapatnamensis TaxID=390880 RepID=A0A7W6RER2_9PROT|nr:class I SAM-dependent methyltransferase [Roseospira visakhapatnamensis]MBB4266701.1 SAM-dependent methyltransferase [Roseospira visakhapatnamensis]
MTQTAWDQRYDTPGYLFGLEPSAFLVAQRHRLARGMEVLAVADGEGRNGVWLAAQGMTVHAVDGSAVALRKAARLARDRGVSLRATRADLVTWDWPRAACDAVVSIFLHLPPETRPAVNRAMARALKPGGVLILEAFHPEQRRHGTGGPSVASMLYDQATLRADFEGLLAFDLLEDGEVALGPGVDLDTGHDRVGHTIRLVGERMA